MVGFCLKGQVVRASETGEAEPAGQFFHFLGSECFTFINRFANAFEDEIFEKFHIRGIDHGGIDFDFKDFSGAGGADFDFVATDGCLPLTGGEFLLFGGKPGLHLLGLFHQLLYIHNGLKVSS